MLIHQNDERLLVIRFAMRAGIKPLGHDKASALPGEPLKKNLIRISKGSHL